MSYLMNVLINGFTVGFIFCGYLQTTLCSQVYTIYRTQHALVFNFGDFSRGKKLDLVDFSYFVVIHQRITIDT